MQTEMLNPSTTSASVSRSLETEKYAVAGILSSFASAGVVDSAPLNLSVSLGQPNPTDLLTPTTLANLEETFLELQGVSQPTAQRESGFVPPIVDPVRSAEPSTMVKQEYQSFIYQDESSSEVDSDWMPTAKKGRFDESAAMMQAYDTSPRAATSGGRRRRKNDEHLTPEEDMKRRLRRERNKVAAAKCRQRRVDLTNTLIHESEGLEEEQSKLENEIQMLQQQKEQLEFLLEAHQPVCSAGVGKKDSVAMPPVSIKSEKVDFEYPSVLSTAAATTSSSTFTSVGRPTSLSIPSSQVAGIPITTPSSVFNFGLESMLDGHTGLTPITGAPSCASQIQRSTAEATSSSSSEPLSSPTLLAL